MDVGVGHGGDEGEGEEAVAGPGGVGEVLEGGGVFVGVVGGGVGGFEVDAGADVLVAGSAVFGAADPEEAIRKMKE